MLPVSLPKQGCYFSGKALFLPTNSAILGSNDNSRNDVAELTNSELLKQWTAKKLNIVDQINIVLAGGKLVQTSD